MTCDWLKIFDGVVAPKLAFLWGSYGESDDCLDDFLRQHPDATLHVYASNGVCLRNGNCGPREAKEIPQIIQRGIDVASWASWACPGCNLEIVVQLEDNFFEAETCHIAAKIRQGASLLGLPKPAIWRNPNHAVTFSSGSGCFDGIELHGTEADDPDLLLAKACAYSNDGANLSFPGIPNWTGNATVGLPAILAEAGRLERCDVYLWSAAGNCITRDSWKEPFPANRVCSPLDTRILTELNNILLSY